MLTPNAHKKCSSSLYINMSERHLALILVIFATMVGLFVRLVAPLQSVFPLNDGGLFYAMIRDIQQHGYSLPLFMSYNHVNLPFAYPPLVFYMTGLLADLTHISLLDLIRLFPALISGLTVPVFYLLAKQITTSKIHAVLATFSFALLPRAFDWLIMGGGITRSFGLLFAILTMAYSYKFYATKDKRNILLCILFGTLVVLTHPEATVHTAIAAVVFYFWKDRSFKGMLFSIGIAASILVLSSPWWGIVLSRYGPDPFLASLAAARQNSFNQLVGLVVFFRFLFADEPYLTILSSLGAVGFFASLNRKWGLLPIWLFAIHFIEPRGGTLYLMIPLALLVGLGMDTIILPGLMPFRRAARAFLILLFFYTTFSAYSVGLKIYQDFSLNPSDLEAFQWVKQNTPENSQFLLVTGQEPLRDAWSEWFPVLTDRISQTTVFGYEWLHDGKFKSRVDEYNSLKACAYHDASCLEEWDFSSNNPFSYVYIYNRTDPRHYPLTIYLQQNKDYKLVFQNDQTMIFQKTR